MLQYRFYSIVHGMSMFIKKSKISRIKHFAIKITTLSGNADDEKNKIVVIQDHIFWVLNLLAVK